MKPIYQYEDQYGVCKNGDVLNIRTGKVLAPYENKQNGYLYVSLWKNNKGNSRSVHRLVAEAFIPNPDNKPFVNHRNSVRTDANVSNLEWCTQQENINHGYSEGHMSQDFAKNFTEVELVELLSRTLAGESMTFIAAQREVGLSRLTINIRNMARSTGLEDALIIELKRQKDVRNTAANAAKRTPVLQFTPDGEFIAEHVSVNAGAASLGKKSSGSIANALNPAMQQRLAYGYLWKLK